MAVKLKLKASSPSPPPFSWDDIHTSSSLSPPSDPAGLPSPPTQWLSARDMKMYGADPLRSNIGIVKCKDCDKPILKSAIGEHVVNCQKIQALAKKNAKGKAEADGSSGQKRKADQELDDGAPAKKKGKAMPKATNGRLKGPVDLDRQCGVINDKGLPCARKLTCKSHSMGAKRSVEGRSQSFDALLLAWNREHNPNFVEPVKKESKAEKKEKKDREKAEKKRLAQEAAAAAAAANVKQPKKAGAAGAPADGAKKGGKKAKAVPPPVIAVADAQDDAENWDNIDSEAEVDSLVQSIRSARDRGAIARPLAVPCDAGTFFVARRELLRNCRDLLVNSLTPSSRGGSVAGMR